MSQRKERRSSVEKEVAALAAEMARLEEQLDALALTERLNQLAARVAVLEAQQK